MGGIFIIFNFLVICSALVDSFPYPVRSRSGAYQSGILPSDPLYIKSHSNINPQWARNFGIPQNRQRPILVPNRANYKKSERQLIDRRNFARPLNAYGYGQHIKNYDSVTPVATIQNGYYPQWPNTVLAQYTTPATLSTNNELSKSWLQRQQNQFYGRPHLTNNLVQKYDKPYVNQDNYIQGYSHNQLVGVTTPNPVENIKSFEQLWMPQNLYNFISSPRPVEYMPWPVSDNEKLQPTESNLLKEYVPTPPSDPRQNTQMISPEPPQQDDQGAIVSLQETEHNQTVIPEHYIIIHMNGTQEHVNNLDNIVFDKLKVAHIKSNDKLKPIMAIVEVEETENQHNLESPYDTGITKIPRDTNTISKYYDNVAALQNYNYPYTQVTTEDTPYDMSYFKPEYIMPIQSTTENAIDSSTNSVPHPTTTNDNFDSNSFFMQSASTTDRTSKQPTYSITDSVINTPSKTTYDNFANTFHDNNSTEDINVKMQEYLTTETPLKNQSVDDYNNYFHEIDDIEETQYNTYNVQSQRSSRIEEDKNGNNFDDFDLTQSSDLSKWTEKGVEYEKAINNYEPEETSNINNDVTQKQESITTTDSSFTFIAKEDSENENYSDKNNSPVTGKPSILKKVYKIDALDLKKVVGKPTVWFRPDANFWDKVTKGEQGYDAVSFYDVKCKPKLIERLTTIHHYANGTETVDYVETIWDDPGAINPREITSKREFYESE